MSGAAHATRRYPLVIQFPGWDSIETVSAWSRGFSIAGLAVLAFLVVLELAAFVYSARRDFLVAERERKISAPRHLTDAQKSSIVNFLTGLQKGSVMIKASANANDARPYAEEIAALLTDERLGWTVRVDNAVLTGPDTSGLWITVGDSNPPPVEAGVLQNAFATGGIHLRGMVDPTVPQGEVWLSVGAKEAGAIRP
jgi:hypothetical protein